MNRRSPSSALAAPMRSSSSAAVAVSVPLGQRALDSQHVPMSPYGFRGSRGGRWGQPGRLSHGDVVLGTDMCAGYPAGVERPEMITSRQASTTPHGAASADRFDPRHARLLPVQGRRRPGDLRGQGEVAAEPAVELLPEPRRAAAPHGADGGERRDRRVDRGPQRGRGAHARVLADQAARAPVQRPLPRRQELPVPRRHPRPGVAPAHGHAGPQAQGRPLLRPVRPRLRHPGDARPAAADLPGAHLQRRRVPTPRAARPALPQVPHRDVPRAVRRRDRQARSTTGSSPSCASSSTATPTRSSTGSRPQMREAADAQEYERAARFRDRLDLGAQGHREAADGRRAQRGPRRRRHRRRRPRGRRCRSSTSAGAGSSAATGFVLDKAEDLTPGELVDRMLERLYAEDPAQGIPKMVLVPTEPAELAAPREVAVGAAGQLRRDPRAPAGRQAGAARDRRAERQGGVHPPPAAPGDATTTAGPGPSTSCRTTSACPTPRCGSSATT